jgi:hypothetical protein
MTLPISSPMSRPTRRGGGLSGAGSADVDLVDPIGSVGRERLSWRHILLPWVVSRLVAIAALTGVDSVSRGRVDFSALADWDSGWYLAIARHGYGHGPIPVHWEPSNWSRWPFFPLLPAFTRIAMSVGVPPKVAIVSINNVAFLVALAGVYRLASRHMGGDAAAWAVWALALFPGSITSVMGYPGGLFVAGSVWAFALVEDECFVLAGVALLVAVATRPNGIVVAVALLPAIVAVAGRTGSWLGAVAKVNFMAAGFLLGWCIWLYRATGDPLVFLHAKSAWLEKSVIDFVRQPNGSGIVHLFLAAIAVTMLIWQRDRLPLSWKVLAVVSLTPSLTLGLVGLGRYAAECFPVAVASGMILMQSRRGLRDLYLALSTVGLVTMGVLVRNGHLTP